MRCRDSGRTARVRGGESTRRQSSCRFRRRMSPARAVDRLIRKRDRDDDAIVRTQVSRDVTLSGRVFDQIDLTRPRGDLLAISNLNLATAAEGDDVLALRTNMPVAGRTGRSRAELHTRRVDHL